MLPDWYDNCIKDDDEGIVTQKDAWDNMIDYFEENDIEDTIPKKKDMQKYICTMTGSSMVKSSTIHGKAVRRFWRDYSLAN